MHLMIVESPTKARKISSLLGSGWTVRASIGHVVDLPEHGLGIDPATYALEYKPGERGKKVLAGLKPLVKSADTVYLATDPDREGEAIAFHLREQLKLKSYKRITFHEITAKAVEAAIAAPRALDLNLVHAQEARRALDRLIGYKVSPALSNGSGQQLSAGRCQSPALRLVVERAREIETFKPVPHFSASVSFDGGAWQAGWDTKAFANDDGLVLDQSIAEAASACRDFSVTASEETEEHVAPPPPFTTSSLLQTAITRLGFSADEVQALAQSLFENGLITYHRTDNPNIDPDAAALIRDHAKSLGLTIAPTERQWKTAALAQEAHGAIRPTHIEQEAGGGSEGEQALYDLIRKRSLASQLEDARYRQVSLRLATEANGQTFEFTARGRTLISAGWTGMDSEIEAPETEDDETGTVPVLAVGTVVTAEAGKLLSRQTKAPAAFTEATLIQKLEKLGIGRPSTFAAIVSRLISRGHLARKAKKLAPGPQAALIVDALSGRFSFLDYNYTSDLESRLDGIADGKGDYLSLVRLLDQNLNKEISEMTFQSPENPCPTCGKALHLIKGKNGPFWGCSAYREGCKFTCEDAGGKPGTSHGKSAAPSEKQLGFAKKLSSETGDKIPADALSVAGALSDWIDAELAKQPPRPASDKQKGFIKMLIEKEKIDLPEVDIEKMTLKDASAFIDLHAHRSAAVP